MLVVKAPRGAWSAARQTARGADFIGTPARFRLGGASPAMRPSSPGRSPGCPRAAPASSARPRPPASEALSCDAPRVTWAGARRTARGTGFIGAPTWSRLGGARPPSATRQLPIARRPPARRQLSVRQRPPSNCSFADLSAMSSSRLAPLAPSSPSRRRHSPARQMVFPHPTRSPCLQRLASSTTPPNPCPNATAPPPNFSLSSTLLLLCFFFFFFFHFSLHYKLLSRSLISSLSSPLPTIQPSYLPSPKELLSGLMFPTPHSSRCE